MSNIEWTEATWNPVSGCTKISEGVKIATPKKWGKLGQIDKTLVDGHIDGVECRDMPESVK